MARIPSALTPLPPAHPLFKQVRLKKCVEVSSPPASRTTTPCTFRKWQMTFFGPHHGARILGQKTKRATNKTKSLNTASLMMVFFMSTELYQRIGSNISIFVFLGCHQIADTLTYLQLRHTCSQSASLLLLV